LRYFEAYGAVKQAVSIIKKRSGTHERTIREFKITQTGIVVGEALTKLQGVLNGIPTFIKDMDKPASATIEGR